MQNTGSGESSRSSHWCRYRPKKQRKFAEAIFRVYGKEGWSYFTHSATETISTDRCKEPSLFNHKGLLCLFPRTRASLETPRMVGGKATIPHWEKANEEWWETAQISSVIKNTPTCCLVRLMSTCAMIITRLEEQPWNYYTMFHRRGAEETRVT